MMPSLLRVREYVEAANLARRRAQSERKSQPKQILQEIEPGYRRLVEIERWAVDQQQYNRPFAHFGLFNGHAARTSVREDIVSRSADQESAAIVCSTTWAIETNYRPEALSGKLERHKSLRRPDNVVGRQFFSNTPVFRGAGISGFLRFFGRPALSTQLRRR